MTRPHLVLNLNARRIARGDRVRRALREAAGDACIVHETRSRDDLRRAADAIARARPAAVVLAGGDGSYMAGITALRAAYGDAPLPAIGLAPGGTASTVARNYAARGDLARHAARVVRAARSEHISTRRIPTLSVADDAGGDRTGFIFGAGLVASFIDLYEADGARGYVGAARIVARIFAGSFVAGATARRVLTPVDARITVDGMPRAPRAFSLIVAAAVKDLGLGMRVTYRAGEDETRVHFVASPLGPRALGPQMPLVLMGARLRGTGHVDELAREVTLDLGRPHSPYVVDGDVFRARAITVRAGPPVRLIVP